MKIRHGAAIIFSGALWMGVGVLLLVKGFSLLLHPAVGKVSLLMPYMGSFAEQKEQASLILISIGLVIGFFKGRFVLAKSAARVIARIVSLPNPCSVFSMYTRSYVILIGSMMLMGMSLRWVSIPYDIKGIVDVAIGSALTNGSAFYFRYFAEQKKKV